MEPKLFHPTWQTAASLPAFASFERWTKAVAGRSSYTSLSSQTGRMPPLNNVLGTRPLAAPQAHPSRDGHEGRD